ncbi:aldo/keto reductase [Streptomyces sp. 900116325]
MPLVDSSALSPRSSPLAPAGTSTVWSPLVRGRLARPFDQANTGERGHRWRLRRHALQGQHRERPGRHRRGGAMADAHGMTRAQVALAWLRRNHVVAAPVVGARTIQQIDDGVASLDIDITDEEAGRLEAPCTPHYDLQGISDEREMERIKASIPGYANL